MRWIKRLFKKENKGYAPLRPDIKDVDMNLVIRWEEVQDKIDSIVADLEPSFKKDYDQYRAYALNGGTASFQGFRDWKYAPKRFLVVDAEDQND